MKATATGDAHARPPEAAGNTAAIPPTPPTNLHKHLRKSAGAKDPDILPAFLAQHPSITLADLDATAYDGRGALHMASWTGALANVQLLLDRGCDINAIATRNHNYGKSPIFFAATRSRENVMDLLLERGANVLIVNNKGQSVYSIACSHFGKDLVQRIKEVEAMQEREYAEKHGKNGSGSDLGGWVDYHKTHPDGHIYGDLDLRFLGRPLTEDDVVKDGVVNPTTKQTRKGNFARNNPHAFHSRKRNEGKAKKEQPPPPPTITEDERRGLEQSWDGVQAALKAGDAWGVFSSLLDIVMFMERKKMRTRWVVDCTSRLERLVRLEQSLGEIREEPDGEGAEDSAPVPFETVLSEAIVFCGSGDRHATLVKRILVNAGEGQGQCNPRDDRSRGEASLSEQESIELQQWWNDAEVALARNNPRDAFLSLVKIVVLWDAKNIQWLNESILKLHMLLDANPASKDATIEEMLGHCERSNTRHTSLLQKMLTKTIDDELLVDALDTKQSTRKKTKKKDWTLPEHYHLAMDSLRAQLTERDVVPSWAVLMNDQSDFVNGEKKLLSLPCPPTWVNSLDDLQSLRSKLHHALNNATGQYAESEISFEKLIAFDSEFRTESGKSKLATIQFSVLEDGIPLAWVVDLHPDPPDSVYSTSTCDFLRWLFLESDAHLLGFAHRHDVHVISSYLEEEIPASSPHLWDVQLLAAHKMAGVGTNRASLPGLKTCCSYFLEASDPTNDRVGGRSWELSKVEQCSDWTQRPLTTSQLEYAGLDAAVLLILLAELVRK